MKATVTATALAAHLFCGRESIGGYLAAHVIEKRPDGKFDPDQCRERVLKHLRDRAAGRVGRGAENLAAERAKLAMAQTETAQIRNRAAAGATVSIGAVVRVIASNNEVMREAFLGLPGKVSDALSFGDTEKRAIIEERLGDAVNEVLDSLSDPTEVAKWAASYKLRHRL
jgi:hypothetical protein